MDQIVPIFPRVKGTGRNDKTIRARALGFISEIGGARRGAFGQVNVGIAGDHIQGGAPCAQRRVLGGDLEIKIAAVGGLVGILSSQESQSGVPVQRSKID